MAYVPPHRRIAGGGQSSSTPIAPPLSVHRPSNNEQGNYRGKTTKPLFIINYARNSLRSWFAVDGNANPPNLLLEFKPFPGESFPHLRDEKLYTISVDHRPIDDVEINLRSLTINEPHPWKYTWEKIKDDLRETFQNVENYVEIEKPDNAKPYFTARFGKILFSGGGLAFHEKVSTNILEENFKGERALQNPLRKTFDTHIPKDIFEALQEKIIAGLANPKLKEKDSYYIEVEDNLNSDIGFGLTCHKKGIDDKQLELKKIEVGTVRHFVADISCLNRLIDLRLIVVTTKLLKELSENHKECIEGIVKSACIEETAKGGLQWPLGGSVRNRFKVTRAWHRNVTTIVGESWKLKFQRANRAGFKASSFRVSNEVDLRLKSIAKYLRDKRQWEEENIMKMLEDILKWVWMEWL